MNDQDYSPGGPKPTGEKVKLLFIEVIFIQP
jgi:hypothetical protein